MKDSIQAAAPQAGTVIFKLALLGSLVLGSMYVLLQGVAVIIR